jgi:hypothetical protein
MLRERLGTIHGSFCMMTSQRYDGPCSRSRIIDGKCLWVVFSERNVFTNRETTLRPGDIIDILNLSGQQLNDNTKRGGYELAKGNAVSAKMPRG